MFRWAILILDGHNQTSKLVTSNNIITKYVINNLEFCEITDSEVITASQLKWPNLKIL
jgi:hypothetical protein